MIKKEFFFILILLLINSALGQNSDIPGYGLGLAIAARAISLHKGTIQATNRKEGGLCITVTLPLV